MTKSKNIVSIGEFSFDPDGDSLRDSTGTKVALRPQTARVLGILVAAESGLVTKDALMRSVWPDTHVTDDSLVQCISEIRKTLGPEAGGLLKTVPKQGYRLDATLQVADDAHPRRSRVTWYAAAAILVAVVVVTAFIVLRPVRTPDAQPAQSIA